MSRKWMAWVLVPALALTLSACPKKQPATPEEEIAVDTTRVDPTPPAPQEVEETPDLTAGDETEEALPSDVQELNRVLRERGLINDVYFDYDEAELRAEAIQQLNRNATWLRENPAYGVLIEGHADERGTNEYNLALGERRANVARDYITSLGIGGDRLSTLTYGEERPVCTESTEGCWQRNRRAAFVVRPR